MKYNFLRFYHQSQAIQMLWMPLQTTHLDQIYLQICLRLWNQIYQCCDSSDLLNLALPLFSHSELVLFGYSKVSHFQLFYSRFLMMELLEGIIDCLHTRQILPFTNPLLFLNQYLGSCALVNFSLTPELTCILHLATFFLLDSFKTRLYQ